MPIECFVGLGLISIVLNNCSFYLVKVLDNCVISEDMVLRVAGNLCRLNALSDWG